MTFSSALLLSALAVTGCGGGDDEEHDHGVMSMAVSVDPNPPTVGRNTLYVEVEDALGAPMTDVQLVVDPQMPAHGHGSTETPVITSEGGGRYKAYPVTFQMAGAWEVTIEATAGDAHKTITVSYDVR